MPSRAEGPETSETLETWSEILNIYIYIYINGVLGPRAFGEVVCGISGPAPLVGVPFVGHYLDLGRFFSKMTGKGGLGGPGRQTY